MTRKYETRGVFFRIRSAVYRAESLPAQPVFCEKVKFLLPKKWSDRADQLHHFLPHFFARQGTNPASHIVLEMARIIGRRDRAGHGWVRDDPFQEKLRPGSAVEFLGPFRQRFRSDSAEKIAAAEWTIDDHGHLLILRQRQNPRLGFAFHDRIVDLQEIELLGAQHFLDLVERARIVMGDPDVAKT